MLDTPSPEVRRSNFCGSANKLFMAAPPVHATPKAVCRKIANSPAFLATKGPSDYTELSMSPLQLMDSPVHHHPAAPGVMTPGASSGETPSRKQTSTPQTANTTVDTPKNRAFHVASTVVKAKRRLIDEETSVATKKLKPSTSSKKSGSKRSFGQINSGVSHRIRQPDKKPKLSLSLSLSDIKKAKAQRSPRNPLDPPAKIEVVQVVSDEKKSTDELPIKSEQVKPVEVEKAVLGPLLPVLSQNPSVASVTKKPVKKVEPVVPHKPYVSNWNQRYRNKDLGKERKFFKSRADRVVTVSVNDNLKLQILEKPPTQAPKKPAEDDVEAELIRPASAPLVQPARDHNNERSNISMGTISQEWEEEDPAESMDISTNIQDILNGLSEDEAAPQTQPQPSGDDSTKENIAKIGVNTSSNSASTENKLFPLFYKDAASNKQPTPTGSNPTVKKANLKSQWIRARNDGQHQTILDAGQKAFGAVQCPDCMLVYHVKEPEDELLHSRFHDSLRDNLKFTGWKKERLVRRFESEGAEILAVHPGDPVHCWKKMVSVLKTVVDHELGFPDIGILQPDYTKIYFYVTDKKIVGVLVAEPVSRGYRMIPSTNEGGNPSSGTARSCSTTPIAAVVGVSRIWTLASYRRRNIASRLLDAMRSDFVYGKVISKDEVAFSDPTDSGLALAKRYVQRPDFLIYKMCG